jgi:hypothetical protein
VILTSFSPKRYGETRLSSMAAEHSAGEIGYVLMSPVMK